jgi:hypothetical protein
MSFIVRLNPSEVAELDRQAPDTKANGGWQNLLVTLQCLVDRQTGRLVLTSTLVKRIQRYAFNYRKGGWQARLRRVFGRTLGPNLDGNRLRPAA